MHIRTRLILIGLLPLLLLLLFIAGMMATQRQLDSFREKAVFADNMGGNFFNLFVVAHDLKGESKFERPRQQWSSITQVLGPQLMKAREIFSSSEEVELIETLHEYFENSRRDFQELSQWLDLHQDRPLNTVQQGYLTNLTERLHVDLQSAIPIANRISAINQEKAVAFDQRRENVMAFVLVFIAGVILLILWPLMRAITRSVNHLQTGMNQAALGDLELRIAVTGKDELAQLARHFNEMISKLAEVTVARKILSAEVIERKQLEQQLSRRLRHRDVMERITQISLNSTHIEELLGGVLDEMLTVFNADRAYFLYPCDPDAPSWSVPMERTCPEWPGAFARGMAIPMTPEVAEIFREVLASTKPLPYGPAAFYCIPAAVAEQFSIRSMIQMALRPRVGSPWAMGLHHCAQARAYGEDDLLLFQDIGLRVADALSSMIILKNLRESEETLNRAQAVGQIGSWLLDIPSNRLEWSAETYRMFGIPQHEAIDLETFGAAIHPDDRDFVFRAWGEAMAGAPYDIEHRIVAGGQERWVRERAQIERDAEGRPLTGIGTVQDITERKQAEDELKLSAQLLNSTSDTVFLLDPDGNFVYLNEAAWKSRGYTRDEMMGMNLRELNAPEYNKLLAPRIKAVLENGQGFFESAHRCKDGSVMPVEINVRVTESGGRKLLLSVIRDITERKLAEEKLLKSEASLRAILDNIPYLVWLKDTAGRYIAVNEAFLKATRQERVQDVQGKTDFDLWPQELAEKYRADDAKVMATRQKMLTEEPSIMEDGEMHWVETYKTPIVDKNGQLLGTAGFARDITERKEFEEELKRSNIELEQFSYAVSHDMRQPLRMISSYLQLIEMSLADQLDSEKRDYFNFAIEGAKRIDQMLVALLEYSRVGRAGEAPAWIESRAVLEEALQFLQPAIAEAQARVNISGDWPRIMASHDEILRLLQNLIGNAAKFRIAGRIPEITVTGKMVRNEWHLCVADNGVGIIPDQIKRLFQVFQRLQLRTAYEGNGVGLALCRKIVEHHKGRIWAESAGEGQGSRFYVVLPVPREET